MYAYNQLVHCQVILISASSLNGVERRHSTVPSMEGGLHNTAYVGDPLDSRDVIMMMDTSKKNGSSIRGKTPGHSANLSESFKASTIITICLVGLQRCEGL